MMDMSKSWQFACGLGIAGALFTWLEVGDATYWIGVTVGVPTTMHLLRKWEPKWKRSIRSAPRVF